MRISSTSGQAIFPQKDNWLLTSPEDLPLSTLREMEYITDMKRKSKVGTILNVEPCHRLYLSILKFTEAASNLSHTDSTKTCSDTQYKTNKSTHNWTVIFGSQECSNSTQVIFTKCSLHSQTCTLPEPIFQESVLLMQVRLRFTKVEWILSTWVSVLTVNWMSTEQSSSNSRLDFNLRFRENQMLAPLILSWNRILTLWRIMTLLDSSFRTSSWLIKWLKTRWTDFMRKNFSVQDGFFILKEITHTTCQNNNHQLFMTQLMSVPSKPNDYTLKFDI